jgi:hypothetical protein
MKKIIIILSLLFAPTLIFATSGACSYHNGVNCSAGGDLYGKVICNDGWTNSSVYFSDAEECKISCFRPIAGNCTSEAQYAQLQSQLLQGNVLGQGSSAQYAPISSDGLLRACRDSINRYQAELEKYNQCLINQQSITPITQPSNVENSQEKNETAIILNQINNRNCVRSFGENSFYNSLNSRCECNSGFLVNSFGLCLPKAQVIQAGCVKQLGLNVRYDSSTNKCMCTNDYRINPTSGKCASMDSICAEEYGDNVHPKDDTCVCNDGFEMKDKKCVSVVSAPVSAPKTTTTQKYTAENSVQPATNAENIEIPKTETQIQTPTQPQPQPQTKSKNIFLNIWNFIKGLFK